jgi:uncharacterized protein (UPF0147 family)
MNNYLEDLLTASNSMIKLLDKVVSNEACPINVRVKSHQAATALLDVKLRILESQAGIESKLSCFS